MNPLKNKELELWGGVECTVNRVGDSYFDQMKYNGHDTRIEDLDRFVDIGLKTLRYPFLWERIAPKGISHADWSWADSRLARLKDLNIRPIAGFVHHGSGPKYTNLLDTEFAFKLRDYAEAFAQRYPWIEDYTPLNETFTTARFSGLYGVWYPHKTTFRDCFQMLIHECKATVLAMEAIRKINPTARLIQTDDLGKASSTPVMKYQADFENERRWLGWDLLCGKVNPAHPLWNYIIECGIDPNEVLWFSEHRCPPNVIGINHYPLSNRFFDENFEKYPDWSHGNNGRHRYTDIESVRVAEAPFISAEELFKEAWDRYQIPIAITEVHIDAGREDQIRWFMNIWNSSLRLRKIGIPIEAVTAWGLLGHFDWHCLVSRCEGYYESGVFDLRSPNPRPTAIAQMMKDLASKGSYEHPILENPGWWERSTRVVYPRKFTSAELEKRNENYAKITSQNRKPVRPLLITGARGTLGYAFGRICEARGIPYRLLSRDQLDIALPQSVHAAVTEHHPWAVINAAGFVKVDEAEVNQDRCFRENLQGPVNLAEICAKHDIPFVTFSSDLVFDGKQHIPYVEADAINPLNVYGKSKAESEKRVLEIYQNALIIRTGAFFGPWDEYNFITVLLRNLERKLPFPAASDLKVSPTYVPELVNVTLNLLMDGEHGIWHLTNGGEVSWSELAVEVAQRNRFDTSLVLPRAFSEMGQRAPRPPYSALRSERGTLLRNLDRALSQFMEDSTQTSRSAA